MYHIIVVGTLKISAEQVSGQNYYLGSVKEVIHNYGSLNERVNLH